MPAPAYVHGYSPREAERLGDQAGTLAGLLHHDTVFPPGHLVLECGCGVGAQTRFLAAHSPGARILSIDISPDSAARARTATSALGFDEVRFAAANLFALPLRESSVDHVFLCFVLEHLPDPPAALAALRRVLKRGGTLTVIEGDHGSFYCHPHSEAAQRAVECLNIIQARCGGDALIGRRLYPLLADAGFEAVQVSPRLVYVDDSRPALIEGFSKNTFIAMVEGVREQAVAAGLLPAVEFDRGLADLRRAAEPGGTFCYTFFKAVCVRP